MQQRIVRDGKPNIQLTHIRATKLSDVFIYHTKYITRAPDGRLFTGVGQASSLKLAVKAARRRCYDAMERSIMLSQIGFTRDAMLNIVRVERNQ